MNVDNKIVSYKKLLFVIVFLITINGFTQTITVSGSNWNINTNSTPSFTQPTEAGNNYSGTYESPTNLITISGSIPGSLLNLLTGGVASVVKVHYIPTNWNSNLKLFVKRSGGSASISGLCLLCGTSINGGTTYIEVPQSAPVQFFTINFSGVLGLGNNITFSNINVQLQIQGVSVTVPVDDYSTTIYFTIAAP